MRHRPDVLGAGFRGRESHKMIRNIAFPEKLGKFDILAVLPLFLPLVSMRSSGGNVANARIESRIDKLLSL